jgi:hypothetical protein
MQLPSPPIRPTFGPWAELPREQWTAEQAAEYDRLWAEFRQDQEAFMAALPGVVAEINKDAER